jgi:hypothetical protein
VVVPRTISHWDDNHENYGISPELKFTTLLELKHWLKEYYVKYHRPYTVVHSDMKKR